MAEWKIDITRAVIDTAERALDEYKYKGHTIREWADKITSGEYQLVKPGNNCDIPRYIDAEALKKDLTRFYDNEAAARELIDEQPTADVQPLKRGEWIEKKTFRMKWIPYADDDVKSDDAGVECMTEQQCSCCKRWTIKFTYHIELDYCPLCGARMDGDSK